MDPLSATICSLVSNEVDYFHLIIVMSFSFQNENVDLGEPERMYKLVLAGDAAVGKSSFILRLCKNRFFPSLNSTLGM